MNTGLTRLPVADRRSLGEDIKDVEYSWPIGMPLVRRVSNLARKRRRHGA